MTTLEKIARALDPHPFLELDLALSRNPDTISLTYINRLRMHTETPLANARKAVEALRQPPIDVLLAGVAGWQAAAPEAETYVDHANGCMTAMLDAILNEKD